ncbi:MAG: hypothetical protein ACOC5T_08630 [Elusimicrobiota bacterium]
MIRWRLMKVTLNPGAFKTSIDCWRKLSREERKERLKRFTDMTMCDNRSSLLSTEEDYD